MKSVYLLLATAASVVTIKVQGNDIIWYPVDEEDGVYISIYGEKHRSAGKTRWHGGHVAGKYADHSPKRHKRGFDPFQYERFPFGENQPQYFGHPGDAVGGHHFNGFFNQIENARRPQHQQQQRRQQQFKPSGQYLFLPGGNPWMTASPHAYETPAASLSPQHNKPHGVIWFDEPGEAFVPSDRPSEPIRPNRPVKPQKPNVGAEHDFGRPNRPPHWHKPFNDGLVFPGEAGNGQPQTIPVPEPEPVEPPPMSQCERNCPVTPEFNPVCASDDMTYTNIGRLKCAQKCGKGVSLVHHGNCRRTRMAKTPDAVGNPVSRKRNSIIFAEE